MIFRPNFARKYLTSPFLCLLLGFLLLFQTHNNSSRYSWLVEKTAENKKEETRTEKETEDEKGGEQNQVGKSKKVKRQQTPPPPPDLLADLVFVTSPSFFSLWQNTKNDFGRYSFIDLFANSPRYLHFHSLLV